jgi:putative hydrolase of the HAD superfamily
MIINMAGMVFTVFFDIDGTLLDHRSAEYLSIKAFYAEYKNYFKMNFEEFYVLWRHLSNKYFKIYLSHECSFEEQQAHRVRELFEIVNQKFNCKEALEIFGHYLHNYESNWRPFEDVIPCLNKLSNCRLGIISNGDYNQQKKKLDKLGISQFFSKIITAGEFGIAKPNTKLFEIACAENITTPEKCYYVGDEIEIDIVPCERIGMHGIWLNRSKASASSKDIRTITSLYELDESIGIS